MNITGLNVKVTNYRLNFFHTTNKLLAFIVNLDNVKEVTAKVRFYVIKYSKKECLIKKLIESLSKLMIIVKSH